MKRETSKKVFVADAPMGRNKKARSIASKGDISPRLVDGTTFVLSVDGNSANLVYRGGYSALLSFAPTKGSPAVFLGESFIVLTSKLRRDRGGLGTLDVALGDPSNSGSGGDPENANITTEIDWTLIEKPLEAHGVFDDLFRNTSSSELLLAFKKWDALADEFLPKKVEFKYPLVETPSLDVAEHWGDLTDAALLFAKKRFSGIDSYMLQVPVVRRTTILSTAPPTSTAGQRDDPPKFAEAATTWLKTADKSVQRTKRGAWERTEEWSGFDELDADLYP